MTDQPIDPHLFVVFGGTGDLMHRKLLPALYRLHQAGQLPKPFQVLAVARAADMDDAGFREWAKGALEEAGLGGDDKAGKWCDACLHYQPSAGDPAESYQDLATRITKIETAAKLPGNRIFYLALPPTVFESAIEGLGSVGLNVSEGWTRLVIEKPFGRDLESAVALNVVAHAYFSESQIYRIDHYLGKETVQNLMVLRFANPIFEAQWNRDHIESVEITMAESLGVEQRAGYYDQAGALRDMVQSHLTQLLTLVAMEVPVAFEADAIRTEKVKVLKSIGKFTDDELILGQYGGGVIEGHGVRGYVAEPDVAAGSTTETFAALKVEIDNWRWQGVPFLLRTGKRLNRQLTQVVVTFRRAPVSLFRPFDACTVSHNTLRIILQPNEGFELCFEVKAPTEPFDLATRALDFYYNEAYGQLPEAYQTLLQDLMMGDQTLFVRADEVEASWTLYSPVLARKHQLHTYASGSWGPAAADELAEANGGHWWLP